MKFLVIICLFLTSQAVFAKALALPLTDGTRHLLKTGLLFKLDNTFSNGKGDEALIRRDAFREINLLPKRTEEARKLVRAEHGIRALIMFNKLLKFQKAADSLLELDVELDLTSAYSP